MPWAAREFYVPGDDSLEILAIHPDHFPNGFIWPVDPNDFEEIGEMHKYYLDNENWI